MDHNAISRRNFYYNKLVPVIENCNGILQTTFDEYKNQTMKVDIMCKNGHIIEKLAGSITKQGSFCCGLCKRMDMYDSLLKHITNCNRILVTTFKEFCGMRQGSGLITLKCSKGHVEYKRFHVAIMKSPHDCVECGLDSYYNNVNNILIKNGFKIITPRLEFTGCNCVIHSSCINNHEFSQKATRIINNTFKCPQCKIHLHEGYTKMVLELLTGKSFCKVRPSWLRNPKTNSPLEIDLYSQELNLAVEYNGKQHYEYIPFIHKRESNYKDTLFRDKSKIDLLCKRRVRYIVIPYTQKDNLYEYLVNSLALFGIHYTLLESIPDKCNVVKYLLPTTSKGFKKCTICNIEKELFDFNKHISQDGYKNQCKECLGKRRYGKYKHNDNLKWCSSCRLKKDYKYFPSYGKEFNHCNDCIKNDLKLCSKCNLIQHRSEFNKDNPGNDAYCSTCNKNILKICKYCKVKKPRCEFPGYGKEYLCCNTCTINKEKRCSGCNTIKSLTEFNKNGKNSRRPECKQCMRSKRAPRKADKYCYSCKLRKNFDHFTDFRTHYCIKCTNDKEKRCTVCDIIKSYSEFGKSSNKLGVRSRCFQCRRKSEN